jgi:hypothetical protein
MSKHLQLNELKKTDLLNFFFYHTFSNSSLYADGFHFNHILEHFFVFQGVDQGMNHG